MVKTIVDKIVKDYSCPVIMVGDYNSKQSMADYKSFVTVKNGIYDSRYVAERGYAAGNSHSSTPTCPSSEAIDHIFVTGNLRVLRHRHGHAVSVAAASDHKPVFIDVMIGETPIEIDSTTVFEGFDSQKIIKGISASAIKPENIALKKMSEYV
jgi:endonuclease/exonuclease/phosphatase family metal-dependent hydrolase